MAFSIALAGKGGTGKTTLAGLLVKYLLKHGKAPVLAVDADCNSNFNEVLGIGIADTLGNAREDMKKGQVPSGMTKDVFISMKLEEAVVEADGFDLIVPAPSHPSRVRGLKHLSGAGRHPPARSDRKSVV